MLDLQSCQDHKTANPWLQNLNQAQTWTAFSQPSDQRPVLSHLCSAYIPADIKSRIHNLFLSMKMINFDEWFQLSSSKCSLRNTLHKHSPGRRLGCKSSQHRNSSCTTSKLLNPSRDHTGVASFHNYYHIPT